MLKSSTLLGAALMSRVFDNPDVAAGCTDPRLDPKRLGLSRFP